MKTMIKKFVMPIAVMCIAITVALAGNVPQEAEASSNVVGFKKIGAQCVETSILCSTVEEDFICTDGLNDLYEFNGTSCPNILYVRMD